MKFYNSFTGFFIMFILICAAKVSSNIAEMTMTAFNADSIEYDLPLYNTKQWVIGDTITFTLPLNIKDTGTVQSVQ